METETADVEAVEIEAVDLRALGVRPRALTVDEYHAMGAAGVFGPEERVELLDGRIIAMSPIGTPHLLAVNRLTFEFSRRLLTTDPPLALVSVQNPIRLHDRSEPEPDVVLIRPDAPARTPTPADVLLVVEVSDATLAYDRTVKRARYAAAGVPEVWVVALAEGAVEVSRRPSPRGYAETRTYRAGEAVGVAALPGVAPVPVADVLGPA